MFDIWGGLKHNGIVKYKGFTLIEIIVVMAIIMILSVVGIGSYTSATIKAKDTQRKNDLNQMSKALEAINNDIERYPAATTDKKPTCYTVVNKVVSTAACVNNQLTVNVEGQETKYIKIVDDPDAGQDYIYTSDGASFAYYAALSNPNDKDLIVENGVPNLDPWNIDCGNKKCNYKVTEAGVAKSI